jgi:coenzyme F420-reducing hydrogenase beta subunit
MYFDTKMKDECCGCKACYSICPENVIFFEEDNEGFFYPVINTLKCIKCDLCRKVCPINNTKLDTLNNHHNIYACYVNDTEKLKKSTSGGIFILLSDVIISQNGIVCGCKWNSNIEANHDFAFTKEERDLFCGSKYVQSDINNTFVETKKYLDSGKKVLFTGTPCQIQGLKYFLKKEYDNLYTMDIICHGVPSPGVFRDYIKSIERKKNKKICDFKFRDKTTGWSRPTRKIIFSDGCVDICLLQDDGFNRLYLMLDAILRPSCYECLFSGKERVADITVGDFWGVQEIYPDMFNNDNGVSVVMLNTQKGLELFYSINTNCFKAKRILLEEARRKNTPLNHSSKRYVNRELLFNDYNKYGIEYCIRKYCFPNILKKLLKKIKSVGNNLYGYLYKS